MDKFKKGDRVVLKDASGVSLFLRRNELVFRPILPGHLGTVTCSYNEGVNVLFDGDNEDSQRLFDHRFEKLAPEVNISKKVFFPCSHDYQELEDVIVLPCFQIGKVLITKEYCNEKCDH
jgi:hypothetical protein